MKRCATALGLLVTALTGCDELANSPASSTTPPQVRVLAGETRDYLQWPFPADSIWNMSLHTNANYSSAGIQAANQFGFAADEDTLILTPNAPLKTVYVNTAGWDASKTRCGTINYALKNFGGTQVPVPDNFSTDPGYGGTTPNQSAAILMPDGVTVKQTQPLHVCGNGGTVTSGGDANGAWEYPDDNLKTGDGIGGAHGGPRMSSIGGTIRVGELRPGSTLKHALKLQIDGKFLKYNDDGRAVTVGPAWPPTATRVGTTPAQTRKWKSGRWSRSHRVSTDKSRSFVELQVADRPVPRSLIHLREAHEAGGRGFEAQLGDWRSGGARHNRPALAIH